MSKRSAEVIDASKSASEKRAIAALRRAEKKREEREKHSLFVYAARRPNKMWTLPYFAKTDAIAAQSFRSFLDSVDGACLKGSDLYQIGEYNVQTGVFQPLLIQHFITY